MKQAIEQKYGKGDRVYCQFPAYGGSELRHDICKAEIINLSRVTFGESDVWFDVLRKDVAIICTFPLTRIRTRRTVLTEKRDLRYIITH